MLGNIQLYVEKWGELEIDKTSGYRYTGGSPVFIDSNGKVSGDFHTNVECVDGIAQNSFELDDSHPADKCSFLIAPNIVTIKYDSDLDEEYPWYPGLTWAMGDLLRPSVSTGTTKYAVWTNAVYGYGNAGEHQVYHAKLVAFTGTSTVPTSLTLLFKHCVHKKA